MDDRIVSIDFEQSLEILFIPKRDSFSCFGELYEVGEGV